jgi:hypothetical protein
MEPETAAAAASGDTGRSVAIAEDDDTALDLTETERKNIHDVYWSGIVPFLRDPDSSDSPLADAEKARVFFEALRRQNPEPVHESLRDLESICEEERQLTRQRRMYLLLHGWLLVHVPLSITLLVLGAIHAFVAIRY